MGIHLPKAATLLMAASAVVVFGAWSMFLIDHGRWGHPVPSMKMAQYAPTPDVAVAAVTLGPERVHPKWSSGLP
jgi:hypothetical protein